MAQNSVYSNRAANIARLNEQIRNYDLTHTQGFYGKASGVNAEGELVGNFGVSKDTPEAIQVAKEHRAALQELEDQKKLKSPNTSIADKAGINARRAARAATVRGISAGQAVINSGIENSRNFGRFLGGVPTPGGVGVPLTILLVLFLAIVQNNGHTRLMWAWLTLIGHAHITIAGSLVNPNNPNNTTNNQSPVGGAINKITQGSGGAPSLAPELQGTQPTPAMPNPDLVPYGTNTLYMSHLAEVEGN